MTTKKFNHDVSDKPFDVENIKDQFNSLSNENKSTQKAIAHFRADFRNEINQLKRILLKGQFTN